MPCFGDDGDGDEEIGRLPGERKYAKVSFVARTKQIVYMATTVESLVEGSLDARKHADA